MQRLNTVCIDHSVLNVHQSEVSSSLVSERLIHEGKKKKNDRQHTCATSVSGNDSWKEVMLQKISDLEAAQQAAEANTKKITAENDALCKEVGRLRHLEQVRSIPTPTHYPVTH